jgi:hypothetical protein
MEKIYFVNFKDYDAVFDSFEKAEECYLEYSEDVPIELDGSERIVEADAMEIDFLVEECKTNTALFIDEDTGWVVYLKKEVNEEIAELRKYNDDYPNARLFELRNVKKFKPKTVFVLDEE